MCFFLFLILWVRDYQEPLFGSSVPFAAVSSHSSCGFVEEPKAGLLLTGPEEDFL